MSATKDYIALDDAMISFYPSSLDPTSSLQMSVREYLDGIRIGTWMKHSLYVREAKGNKDEYAKRKRQGGGVTFGATFTHRDKDPKNLLGYSGFQIHDLDHLDADRASVKAQLGLDPFVYAVWDSIGGDGLCLLFRVDPARWDDAFLGIQDYLCQTYGLFSKFDPSGKDISRLRYNSFDPGILVKDGSVPVFKSYPKKAVKKKPVSKAFVHTEDDFRFVFEQVIESGVDITPEYGQRRDICFAIISKFGESGYDYFYRICQNHAEFNELKTERMWKSCMGYGAREISIATFYYHCKQAGLEVMRPRTREIVSMAAAQKKQGGTIVGTVDTLKKMEGFDPAETEPIVRQVYESREEFQTSLTLFDELELFIRQHYPLRYNEVRRVYEDASGQPMEDKHFYAIYIHAHKVVDNRLRYEDLYKLVHSGLVSQSYHPIKEFFIANRDRKPTGVIKQLVTTIKTDTGFADSEFMPDYAYSFIRKWLIGVIATVYGEPCPLVLMLTGPPNTGKTEWFRRMLPPELKPYFVESKWKDDKDEEVSMCTNLVSFNDEFKGGKSREMEHFKALTSKDWFTLRLVFERKPVRLQRLAVMCGTSNTKNVISEPEYNRRIIPINVLSIDFAGYNALDKTDLLMEAFHAYMNGERHHLTKDEVKALSDNTEAFQNKTIEQQMVDQYISIPLGEGGEVVQFLSTTEIMSKLELRLNNRKLDINKTGAALQANGFDRIEKRFGGSKLRAGKKIKGYNVILVE